MELLPKQVNKMFLYLFCYEIYSTVFAFLMYVVLEWNPCRAGSGEEAQGDLRDEEPEGCDRLLLQPLEDHGWIHCKKEIYMACHLDGEIWNPFSFSVTKLVYLLKHERSHKVCKNVLQ